MKINIEIVSYHKIPNFNRDEKQTTHRHTQHTHAHTQDYRALKDTLYYHL